MNAYAQERRDQSKVWSIQSYLLKFRDCRPGGIDFSGMPDIHSHQYRVAARQGLWTVP
jgi:hypothetical protein